MRIRLFQTGEFFDTENEYYMTRFYYKPNWKDKHHGKTNTMERQTPWKD